MSKEDLTPGDLVQLKSGGPVMTYEGEALYGDALCCWFVGGKRMRESFSYASLKRAE